MLLWDGVRENFVWKYLQTFIHNESSQNIFEPYLTRKQEKGYYGPRPRQFAQEGCYCNGLSLLKKYLWYLVP